MFYQQGDVLLEVVEEVQGQEIVSDGIVALGESTGHSHRFKSIENIKFFRNNKMELFIDVLIPTALKHQEHKKIIVPKGKYRIGIVKEFDHFLEESRNVRD